MPKLNWKVRRVAFVLSDAYHTLSLANAMMKVRVKELTGEGAVYEGDVELKWAELQLSHPRLAKQDLVGVLVSSDTALEDGKITWLAQTEGDEATRRRATIIAAADKAAFHNMIVAADE